MVKSVCVIALVLGVGGACGGGGGPATSEADITRFLGTWTFTGQNTQTGGFAGTDLNAPTGAGQTQFHNAGIALFPSPQVVLKATWQRVINRDPLGANSDSVLGGVGFFF